MKFVKEKYSQLNIMKNIQNLGGFVLISSPFSKTGNNIDGIDAAGSSAILKYDYCVPPTEENMEKQRRKNNTVPGTLESDTYRMKKRNNAA